MERFLSNVVDEGTNKFQAKKIPLHGIDKSYLKNVYPKSILSYILAYCNFKEIGHHIKMKHIV